MANLDLPKKGSSTKWSLEDDNDEDDLDNTNGKSNEQQESEEEDPLGKWNENFWDISWKFAS